MPRIFYLDIQPPDIFRRVRRECRCHYCRDEPFMHVAVCHIPPVLPRTRYRISAVARAVGILNRLSGRIKCILGPASRQVDDFSGISRVNIELHFILAWGSERFGRPLKLRSQTFICIVREPAIDADYTEMLTGWQAHAALRIRNIIADVVYRPSCSWFTCGCTAANNSSNEYNFFMNSNPLISELV